MPISQTTNNLLKLVTVAAVAVAVSWMTFGRQGSGGDGCKVDNNFSFTTREGVKISAKAEGCKPDTLDLINVLLKEPRTREVITSQLRKEDRLFSIGETTWVAELGSQLCPKYRDGLSAAERLAAAKECVNQPVAAALREHAQSRRPPFLLLAQERMMGVPGKESQPQPGSASGCTGPNGLHGLYVRVSNPSAPERYKDVSVSGSYQCPDAGTYWCSNNDALSEQFRKPLETSYSHHQASMHSIQ
jgi:hypothetical protein